MEWEREAWIEEYQAGESVAEIGRGHQVSRQAVHKWIARHRACGEEGLRELSRAPQRHPHAVSALCASGFARCGPSMPGGAQGSSNGYCSSAMARPFQSAAGRATA